MKLTKCGHEGSQHWSSHEGSLRRGRTLSQSGLGDRRLWTTTKREASSKSGCTSSRNDVQHRHGDAWGDNTSTYITNVDVETNVDSPGRSTLGKDEVGFGYR